MADLRTPLFDWHVSHKARIVPFGGWEMPVQYAGIIEEHKAVRTGCGLFDIGHMARLSFHGLDAEAVLEKVFSNAVHSLKLGQVRYGVVCNDAGGILDDILITRYADHFGVCVNAGNREKIVAWIGGHIHGDAKLVDHTFETAMIAVQGPKAVEVVTEVLKDNSAKLKYYYAEHSKYRGEVCIVSRTGYTGEDGFELVVQNAQAVKLWEELLSKGAVACGLGARDTLRLEAAMPLYGHELNEQIDPIAAGLGWATKLDKDFIGRDAIHNLHGHRPVRVGLKIEGKRAARQDSTIQSGGAAIGKVTSGSYVPFREESIAMGYVPPAFALPGTELAIDLKGSSLPAKVVALPFYKRAKS